MCLACIGDSLREVREKGGLRDGQFGGDNEEGGVGSAVPVIIGGGRVWIEVSGSNAWEGGVVEGGRAGPGGVETS